MKNEKGFTLVELIVVIAILGVLLVVSIPSYVKYVEHSRKTADLVDLRNLNENTRIYYVNADSDNKFEISSSTRYELMNVLIENDFYDEEPIPRQKNAYFTWLFSEKVWILSSGLSKDNVGIGIYHELGWLSDSYSGTAKDIYIGKEIEGTVITGIYQDVFRDKGLTSVRFDNDSSITHIHARAFKDNSITEVELPPSLERIDYGAFLGNDNLTKVTIGGNVTTMEGNIFGKDDNFKVAYEEHGAGTYRRGNDGNWTWSQN